MIRPPFLTACAAALVFAGSLVAAEPAPSRMINSFERKSDLTDWLVHEDPQGVKFGLTEDPKCVTDGGSALRVDVDAYVPGKSAQMVQILSAPVRNVIDFEQVSFDIVALQDMPNINFGQAPEGGIPPTNNYLPRLKAGEKRSFQFPVTSLILRDKPNFVWVYFEVPHQLECYAFSVDSIRFTGSRARTRLLALEALIAKRLDPSTGLGKEQIEEGSKILMAVQEGLREPKVQAEQAGRFEEQWDAWFSQVFREKEPAWGAESSMARVNRSTSPGAFRGSLRPPQLRIDAARNEFESVQLVLFGGKSANGTVDILHEPLKTGDDSLPTDALQVRLADDVDCSTSVVNYVAPAIEQRGKMFADPLLPQTRFELPENETRSVWLTVKVPADARPGTYHTTINVGFNGGTSWSIPLEVNVRNFSLPAQPTMPNLWGFWPYPITNFKGLTKDTADWHGMWRTRNFGEVPPEITKRWLEFLGSYKIGVGCSFTQTMEHQTITWPAKRLPDGSFDFSTYDEWVGRAIENGTNVMCVFGHLDHNLTPKKEKEIHEYIQALHAHLKEKGWLDRAYIYRWDEPSAEQYPIIMEQVALLNKLAPGLKLLVPFNSPRYEDPRFKDFNGVDAPVLLSKLTYPEYADDCRQLGKEPWWYTCLTPVEPYAGTFVFNSPIDMRAIPLQTWKMGYAGYLNWGVNIFGFGNTAPGVENRWPEVPWTFANYEYPPGDGCLTYPDPAGLPLSSIRLENWRDGMEDYEYLTLLRRLIGSGKLVGAELDEAKKLDALDGVVGDLTHFTRDPEVIRKWREAVAAILQKRENGA